MVVGDAVGLALKDHGRDRTLKGLLATAAVAALDEGSAIGGALSYWTLLARLATDAPSLLRHLNSPDPRR